ncbi:TolC family protein [Desulfoferula mesophila]|uniref:Outer membrane protein n=1 Tax=Desulfoferula mesophila TaxID=3058419 RepID=A0AAU9EJ20_9BACT|nr:outer membrane protein [Desulfoferula mesophilus]
MIRAWCGAILVGLMCLAAVPAPGEEPRLTLGEALAVALEQNPTLETYRQEVAQAEGRLTQSSSRWWPQLSGEAGYSRNYSENRRTAYLEGSNSDQYNYYSTELALTQKIYDFGRTGGTVEASRQELSATRHDLVTQREKVLLEVKAQYFEVLKNQHLVTVAQKTLASQAKHVEQAKGYYSTGLRPKIDVTRAQVDLANARLALISAQYNRRRARVALEKVMGKRPYPGDYTLADIQNSPPLPPDLPPLVAEALKQRPETASLQAGIQAAQGRLTSARGGYWPSLDAGADYGLSNTDFPLDNGWSAGMFLTWPLFSGFLTQGQVSEYQAQVRQRQAQYKELELTISQQVEEAWLVLRESAERIDVAEVARLNAEENFRLAQGRYEAGVGDAIEFTDAQVSLFDARSAVVRARYDYLQAFAALERAIGRPLAGSRVASR